MRRLTTPAIALCVACAACNHDEALVETPRATGPLALRITYPTTATMMGDPVTVLGTTGNAATRVVLNGRLATVAANGAFAAVSPALPDGAREHRLVATLAGASVEARIPIAAQGSDQLEKDAVKFVPRPEQFTAIVAAPIVLDIRERNAGRYRAYLFRGAPVVADSTTADSVRIAGEGVHSTWVARRAISRVRAGAARRAQAARAPALGIAVANEGSRVARVRIELPWPVTAVTLRGLPGGVELRLPTSPGVPPQSTHHSEGGVDVSAIVSPAGTVVRISDAETLLGYELGADGHAVVLRLKRAPRSMRELRVLIDPGHPPHGTRGAAGAAEAAVTLAIARELQRALRSRGATVLVTRVDDQPVELWHRVALAAESRADILLSLHADAAPDGEDPGANAGTRTFFLHQAAAPLAATVHAALVRRIRLPDRSVLRRSLAITDVSFSAAILCEIATLTYPDHEVLLTGAAFQRSVALGIAQGVADFVERRHNPR